MFAFLKSSGHDGFWENVKGGAFQESSFAYVERDDVLKERRGISQIWEDFRDLRCKVKEE